MYVLDKSGHLDLEASAKAADELQALWLSLKQETLAEISQPLLELGRKWLRESASASVRVARYGSKDDLEHCADEIEKAIRAQFEQWGQAATPPETKS